MAPVPVPKKVPKGILCQKGNAGPVLLKNIIHFMSNLSLGFVISRGDGHVLDEKSIILS